MIFITEKIKSAIPNINKTITILGNLLNNIGINNTPSKLKIICTVIFPKIESEYT